MNNLSRIDPSFNGVMNQTPCTCTERDCCGLIPEQAAILRDAFQKALGISMQRYQRNTLLNISKRLSIFTQESPPHLGCIRLAHCIAMEKLVGQDKAEALASLAPGLLRLRRWNDAGRLVNEIRGSSPIPDEYLLSLIKSICACDEAPHKLGWAFNIADAINSPRKFETFVEIGIDEAKRGNIANAKEIITFFNRILPSAGYTPEKIKTSFTSRIYDAIRATKAPGPKVEHSPWEQNEDVFNELKNVIEAAFASKEIPFRMEIELPQELYADPESLGEYVLETLGKVATELMQAGLIEQLLFLVDAIQNDLVDDESEKADLIANILVTFACRENRDDHIPRFITHGNAVDVNLVKEIVRHFTTKSYLAKALAIAEEYLKGEDLTEAFDIFAQSLIEIELPSLASLHTIFHSPRNEKGKLFVALVGGVAKKNVQRARDFIEDVLHQEPSLEQNPPEFPISEQDLSEAYIRIAQVRLTRNERLDAVLADLVINILSISKVKTEEVVQKANIRLVKGFLDSKQSVQAGIHVLDQIRATLPSDDLDHLLAKAAIAETEALVDSILENNPDF